MTYNNAELTLNNNDNFYGVVIISQPLFRVHMVHLMDTHTHTQPFNGPLSRTTRVSRHQKGWILLKQETVSGSGISWAICKSAPQSRQITTSAPHHSVFYRPDALPATQPTASKHWRKTWLQDYLMDTVCVITTKLQMQSTTDAVVGCSTLGWWIQYVL